MLSVTKNGCLGVDALKQTLWLITNFQSSLSSCLLIPWNFYELKNHCHLDYSPLRTPHSALRTPHLDHSFDFPLLQERIRRSISYRPSVDLPLDCQTHMQQLFCTDSDLPFQSAISFNIALFVTSFSSRAFSFSSSFNRFTASSFTAPYSFFHR